MRRYYEKIDVALTAEGLPSEIKWRGRSYVVAEEPEQAVEDQWRFAGKWWVDGKVHRRYYYRIRIVPNTRYTTIYQPRSVEIFREGSNWTLTHVCD